MYFFFFWCRWQVDGLHVILGCFEGKYIKRIQEMKERQDCDHCYNSSSICHNMHLRHKYCMMTALEMRYYIGMVLVGLVQGDHQEGAVNSQVEERYRRVREEYDRHRAYYYELVERFRDE